MYLIGYTIEKVYLWLYSLYKYSTSVVGNLRPAGHMRPASDFFAAREMSQEKEEKNQSILHHHKKRASCLEFIGTNDVPQRAYHHHSLVNSYSQTFCKLV